MTETVREWITKAEGDFRTACREFEVADFPNFDAVCFHAQQCVEKLMKGLLIANGDVPSKTHDLLYLSDLLKPHLSEPLGPEDEIKYLTRAAVDFRYPGESADREEAEESLRICILLREKLLKLLN